MESHNPYDNIQSEKNPSENSRNTSPSNSGLSSSIKRFLLQMLRYDIANLKTNLIAGSIYIIIQLITILLFINYPSSTTAFIAIIVPMLLSIIAALVYLIPRRHNPDYVLYPFFHASRTFVILVILSFIGVFSLFMYKQCGYDGWPVIRNIIKVVIPSCGQDLLPGF